MIFADVNDILIPQGNVIKIHETNSGRILWEKKQTQKVLSAHWELSPYTNAAKSVRFAHTKNIIDNGSEVLCFIAHNNNDDTITEYYSYCYYNPVTDTVSNSQILNAKSAWYPYNGYSIDTDSKVWCGIRSKSYYCSAYLDNIVRDDLPFKAAACCWSNDLKRFCIAGADNSCLIDIYGNIYENNSSPVVPNSINTNLSHFFLCSGSALNKFIAYNIISGQSANRTDAISISPDGYNWTYLQKISDILPNSSSNNDRGIGVVWAAHLNAYVAFVGNSSGYYVFKSPDGANWTQSSTLSPDPSWGSSSLYRYIRTVYSPEKQIIATFAGTSAFISNDGINWLEVTARGVFTDGYMEDASHIQFFWCKPLNAFVYASTSMLKKLIID